MMSSRARLLCALSGGRPDRLPATTHHLMPSFLKNHLQGASEQEFFDRFGLDAIRWVVAHRSDSEAGEFLDPNHYPTCAMDPHRVATAQWRVETEIVPDMQLKTTRYRFLTPRGELEMVLQAN